MRALVAAVWLLAGTETIFAQGVGINAHLCGPSMVSGRSTLANGASPEIQKYLEGLRRGNYAFSLALSPEAASSQLGFSRRFNVVYGILLKHANDRVRVAGRVNINEIIEYLSSIEREEMAIERLQNDATYMPSVLYLRALEDGICSFPYELSDVPSADFVLGQLNNSYGDVHFDLNRTFKEVYDATLEFGAGEIKQHGVVTIWQIVEKWRQNVLEWHN